ncbi:AzlC family ABC transporter permease [Brevibacillus sp. B_LB10_24]|uniref:AzlC family ABC transporter permease n=1 Tax=Brevibacillus sp. B_LB10_24 TaxID=3380645 RepID=UPI0038B94E90
MKPPHFSALQVRQGLIDAAPISVSVALFGAIFGMLSIQAGLSGWQSLAMSLIVFAGSSQFTALSMLSERAGSLSIILATFLLNSRHFLMGLSLSPYYRSFPKLLTGIFAFFLTDEQYAIILNRFRHHPSHAAYVFTVGLALYIGWCAGTWLGTIAGQWLPDPAALGLDFSFTAMFLALAYYQLGSLLRILTFLATGAVAAGLALLLPNGLHLLAAGLFAFAVGYFAQQSPVEQEAETT